ncbi:MAG: DNA mismatch repair endonuclease MutL [Candidatus Heimdallarchaeota archaeon]|nr:DNA mismatch repair endonuclease MutL [Candidatus Heimdallarchaeota archaeon]
MIIELDTLTINKIAAGEVIERPASVVKELVENSIDAGSTQIKVVLQEGGKKFIEITDNGSGMNHNDALLSIKRHTTSKIAKAEDLFSIASLGFRGEALASIVSVAQVEIFTKKEDDELGTHIQVEGGKILLDKNISVANGTKITVRNLFYNVPVRRKFLKSETTEMNHITEYITKLALAFPEVSFSLVHNNRSVITAPKGDLISQINSIFGKNIAKSCIPVSKTEEGYTVTGYITKPEFSRKSRDYLYIFVLNRPIVNKIITDAILRGYGTALPHDRTPIVFLNIKIPKNEIDVNVHPTKREVRFSKEAKLFGLVELAVKESLEKSGLEIFERVSEPKYKPTMLNQHSTPIVATKKQPSQIQSSPSPSLAQDKLGYKVVKTRDKSIDHFLPSPHKGTSYQKQEHSQKKQIKILGIIKDTYVIAETNEGLLLCDQHAAHEKINYTKYVDQIKRKQIHVQSLLAPISVSIKPSELEVINDLKTNLMEYGFELEIFGKNEILIRSIPSIMGVAISYGLAKDLIDIFKENIDQISNQVKPEDLDFIKDIVSIFACRRSIKAGDKIAVSEAESLIENLLKLDEPYTCPHGRPTMVILNQKYIEEIFQRDYKS